MTNNIEIQDQTPDRRYFTIIPNILDELELSPYAVRLYLRVKRRAGENGECFENSQHLAEGCNMSKAQISRTKVELEKAGLITIEKRSLGHGHFPGHIITIRDIWKRNVDYYDNGIPVSEGDASRSPGSPRPVPQVVLKNNPINKEVKERKFNNQGQSPTHSPNPEADASEFSEDENTGKSLKDLKNHPTIKAIKEISGFYPPKVLWERIIITFPSLDQQRAKDTFEHWIACHYSPRNFDGWLFDWYLTQKEYIHPGDKGRWDEIQHSKD